MANDKKTTPTDTPDVDPPTAGGDLVVDDPVRRSPHPPGLARRLTLTRGTQTAQSSTSVWSSPIS